jgi:hypothetical protein
METLQQIQPIINGSVNPRLTPELFNDLQDVIVKRQVIWNLLVSMEFAHSFKDVDHQVFQKPDFKSKYANPEIFEHTNVFNSDHIVLNELFVTVRKEFNAHQNSMLSKTSDRRFELGKRIYHAQKELGFGGMVEMDKDRLQGYIKECGSWNDFNVSAVTNAIINAEKAAPRMGYGPNNPNTGNLIHKWKSVQGCEYVVMEFDYVLLNKLEEIKEFYQNVWEPKGRAAKADSIRYEVVEHGSGYFGIELIWWWD